MSRVYARYLAGLAMVRVEIPPRLQRFAKRTNCWIDFDADGFSAGHARRTLVNVYTWNRTKLIVQPPHNQAEVNAIRALLEALGVGTACLEGLGMCPLDVEFPAPFFVPEVVDGALL